MRGQITIFLTLCSAFLPAQDLKQKLFEAYLTETTEKADSLFLEAQESIVDDSTEGLYHYFRFFYFDAWDVSDSIPVAYNRAKKLMLKTKNWFLYFDLIKTRVNILNREAKYDQSVVILKNAIALASNEGLIKYEASMWVNLASVYHDLGDYKSGVEAGAKAMAMAEEIVEAKLKGEAMNVIAISYDDWNKPDSALHYHFMNVKLGQEILGSIALASTYNNIGNTYLKLMQLDSSEKYIRKAVELSGIKRDILLMSTCRNNLADIFLQKKEYASAKQQLDSALYFAEQTYGLEKKRDVYNTLHRYYEAVGMMKEAYHYQKLYHQFKDSMLDLDRLKVLSNLELKAATAEKDREIANVELEVKNRNILLLTMAGLLLLAIVIVRHLVAKRQKHAQQAQLNLQEERLRISRDLHDNIGAELTLISSEIEQQIFKLNDHEQVRSLEKLGLSSRSAMSQLRETIWAIKSDGIMLEELASKVQQLSSRYSESLGSKLRTEHLGENHKIKPAQVINLFRVCKEAITNAMKYASCNSIEVRMVGGPNEVKIEIEDDGVGFELEDVQLGYGLMNMKERVNELDGEFSISSQKGDGTIITVVVPLG